MKNLLLLSLILVALYLSLHPRTQPPVEAASPTVAQATPPPRMYYHSPLDAGAMPTSVSTGAGYYSADPANSRFNSGPVLGAPSSSYNGYPVYYGGNPTGANTTIHAGTGSYSTATAAPQRPRAYVSERRPNHTGNPSTGQRNTVSTP